MPYLAEEMSALPREMTADERRVFLTEGTRTAIIATIRADGRPHATPVWYALDGNDVMIIISSDSVKGRALRRDPRVTIVVDDEAPPYGFVMIEGVAEVSQNPHEIRRGAICIAHRYHSHLGPDGTEEYVRDATKAGAVLVRVHPIHVVARETG